MSLKNIFDAEKAAMPHGDFAFMTDRVLPVVRSILAAINQDPDISAQAELIGDKNGLSVKLPPSDYGWGFNIDFREKASMKPAGRAVLTLAGNLPESAIIGVKHVDTRSPGGIQTVVEALAREAAREVARTSFRNDVRTQTAAALHVSPFQPQGRPLC